MRVISRGSDCSENASNASCDNNVEEIPCYPGGSGSLEMENKAYNGPNSAGNSGGGCEHVDAAGSREGLLVMGTVRLSIRERVRRLNGAEMYATQLDPKFNVDVNLE